MQVPSKLDLFSELRCKYTLNPDSHTKKAPAISIWGTRVELRYLSGQQLFEAYAFNRNQMWHVVIRVTTPEWQTPGVAAGNTCEVLSFLWHEKDIRWATIGKSAVTAILHSRWYSLFHRAVSNKFILPPCPRNISHVIRWFVGVDHYSTEKHLVSPSSACL